MVVFDINQTLLYNLGIGAFSLIISLVIYISYRKNFAETYDVLLLRRMQLSVMVTLLSDMGNWYLDGKGGALVTVLNYICTMVHFIMQIVVVIAWWRYASYRISGRKMPPKAEVAFVWLPLALIILVILSTPWTHLYFYLDEANVYHRGILSLPMYLINLLYPLSVSAIALVRGLRESYRERRSELLTIAMFPVLPVIGGMMQTASFGLSIIWPSAVISSLIILLHKESQAILQDPLTGLNNRRNVERLFRIYEEHQNRSFIIMIMDLDNFKYINDHFGHTLGDQALVESAKILRSTFSGSQAFLARYGGDEFIVAIPHGSQTLAEETAARVRESFEAYQKTDQFPYPLSVSIGYAVNGQEEGLSLPDLLRKADDRMYRDKEANRERIKALQV